MGRTRAKFQDLDEIAATAADLERMAAQLRILIDSLRASGATGAKIVGAVEKNKALKTVDGWVANGYLKLDRLTEALGGTPAKAVTGYIQPALENAGIKGNKIAKSSAKPRAAK